MSLGIFFFLNVSHHLLSKRVPSRSKPDPFPLHVTAHAHATPTATLHKCDELACEALVPGSTLSSVEYS